MSSLLTPNFLRTVAICLLWCPTVHASFQFDWVATTIFAGGNSTSAVDTDEDGRVLDSGHLASLP